MNSHGCRLKEDGDRLAPSKIQAISFLVNGSLLNDLGDHRFMNMGSTLADAMRGFSDWFML